MESHKLYSSFLGFEQNSLFANPALKGNGNYHFSAAPGGWICWLALPGSPLVPALAEPTAFASLPAGLLAALLSLKINVKAPVLLAGAA